MDVMSSGDEYDDKLVSTEILENIRDVSQSHTSVHRIESRHKIRGHIRQSNAESKRALLSTQNMGKGLHKMFKSVVSEISLVLRILGESGSEVSYFIPEPRTFSVVTIFSENFKKPWIKETLK